eukprot:Hpha_TRINITY_DN17503_c0_g1::TRINITY_DN17503_c0_g1_i1::g.92537::m.92537/K01689/ENO, eno; enolase
MALTQIRSRTLLNANGHSTLEIEVATRGVLVRASGLWGPLMLPGASVPVEFPKGEALEKQVDGEAAEIVGLAPDLVGMSCLDQRDYDSSVAKRVPSGGEAGAWRVVTQCLLSRAGCEAAAHSVAGTTGSAPVRGAEAHVPFKSNSLTVAAHIARVFPGGGSSWRSSARMPVPVVTLLSGSVRAGSPMPFRGLCCCPVGVPTLEVAVRTCCELNGHLRTRLKERYGLEATSVGQEGGFGAPLESPEAPFELAAGAIEEARMEKRVRLWLDAGADELWDAETGMYNLAPGSETASVRPLLVSAHQLAELYCRWIKEHGLVAIQSPFAAADTKGWQHGARLLARTGCAVVGQTVATARIALAARCHQAACVIPASTGGVSAATEVVQDLRQAGVGIVVDPGEVSSSPRTEDSFVASLAVGLGAGVLKVGGPARSEGTGLLNELLRLAESMQEQQQQQAGAQRQPARYAGLRLWE